MSILLSLSGGIDSAYLLWTALRNTTEQVNVVFVELLFPDRRSEFGAASCRKIISWMEKELRPVRSFSIGRVQLAMIYSGILDCASIAPIVLSTAMGIDPVNEIWMGYSKDKFDLAKLKGRNDSATWFSRYVEDAWVSTCGICPGGKGPKGRPVPKVLHPLINVSKKEILDKIPKELLDLTWSCQNPWAKKEAGAVNFTRFPCGVCDSCRLRAGTGVDELYSEHEKIKKEINNE